MKKLVISLLNLMTGAVLLTSTAADATEADGHWIWTTPGRNGGPERQSVLSLKADGAQLSGKISTPGRDGKPTDTQITNGKVDGQNISFEVVRVFNENTNITRYTGTVSNGQITGKIETTRNGQAQSRDWLAKNAGEHEFLEFSGASGSAAELKKFLAEHPDATIIDARSPEEYAAGHLPNAKNYNLTDDATYKDVLATITEKSKWYIVHSAVGHYRTVRALEYFEANHFEHVVAIDGGYRAWREAGQQVVKD